MGFMAFAKGTFDDLNHLLIAVKVLLLDNIKHKYKMLFKAWQKFIVM